MNTAGLFAHPLNIVTGWTVTGWTFTLNLVHISAYIECSNMLFTQWWCESLSVHDIQILLLSDKFSLVCTCVTGWTFGTGMIQNDAIIDQRHEILFSKNNVLLMGGKK